MTRKIFRSILLAAAVALLASLATVMGILYPYFSDLQERELGEELKLTATAVERGGLDYLETLTPGTVTIRQHEEEFLVLCLDKDGGEAIPDWNLVRILKKLEGSK